MALNIRKVTAQRAENNQKIIKRQFLYYFNRNCLFHYLDTLCPGLVFYLTIFSQNDLNHYRVNHYHNISNFNIHIWIW